MCLIATRCVRFAKYLPAKIPLNIRISKHISHSICTCSLSPLIPSPFTLSLPSLLLPSSLPHFPLPPSSLFPPPSSLSPPSLLPPSSLPYLPSLLPPSPSQLEFTGIEAKTAEGCPTAEWVIRRKSKDEQFLILYR